MIREDERTVDAVYDDYAANYGYDLHSTLSARLKYELARRYLQPHYQVLDVGCANGIHMQALAGYCSAITGIDINDRMLEQADERLSNQGIGNARLLKRSAAELGLPDASFDLVYSFSTLLLVPDTQCAVAEIARVLRPGGYAILDIIGRYNLSRIYWGYYYRRHGHFGVNSFTFPQLRSLLGRVGLEPIEAHALGFTDQWRYIPGLHWCKFLERIFHGPGSRDLDYRLSNTGPLFALANRWYLVCRRSDGVRR